MIILAENQSADSYAQAMGSVFSMMGNMMNLSKGMFT